MTNINDSFVYTLDYKWKQEEVSWQGAGFLTKVKRASLKHKQSEERLL